jgi:4a-hydroxytetrahydrobiopterin dehydratase
MTLTPYTPDQARRRLAETLPDWTWQDGSLYRCYRTSGWRASLMVANAIGYLAETAWHHPRLQLSYPQVEIWLDTHEAGAVSDRDFELAGRIEALLGWQPEPGAALEGLPETARLCYLSPA